MESSVVSGRSGVRTWVFRIFGGLRFGDLGVSGFGFGDLRLLGFRYGFSW